MTLEHDYDSNVRFLKIGVAYVAQKYFKVLVERCSAVHIIEERKEKVQLRNIISQI